MPERRRLTRPGVFAVLGEGLAAGMGNFSMAAATQQACFPAVLARQMGLEFRQALLEPPGLGDAPGFPVLPVRIPAPMQTRVLLEMPPAPVHQVSFPGLTVNGATQLRVCPPVVHRNNAAQTACNLVIGLGALARGEEGIAPLDAVLALRPGLVLVALGYHEALQAAVEGAAEKLAPPDYTPILSALRGAGCQTVVLNVPDPLDTAYFSTVESAAAIVKVDPDLLVEAYGFEPGDLITVPGLIEIGCHFFARAIGPLPPNAVLKSAAAAKLRARLREWNAQFASTAAAHDALLFDLAALWSSFRRDGIRAGAGTLTADYLGGIYQLNGYYPGATGHAAIAGAILQWLNQTCGTQFPAVDLRAALEGDAAAACRPAQGPNWTARDVPHPLPRAPQEPPPPSPPASSATPAGRLEHQPLVPLQLPEGLEQVLPLAASASYFGDGIGAFNGRDPRDIQWGSMGELIFGGLAMVDSHLSGSLRIRFSPPVDGVTKFQISYEGGFTGRNALLVTPQLFRMPFQYNRVDEVPGTVSAGTLNLATGEVGDLRVFAQYSSTALIALVSVNPTFPKDPLSFPGPYGSAYARFDPRPDGKLDFTFYGSAYVPLGKDIRWPLPFAGPSMQFATVPAQGTVMHPHLRLSTRELDAAPGECPELPVNTIREFTLHTHHSAFGDQFTLAIDELGGPAKGRSHVMGRLQIQFGAPTGGSVPIAVTGMNPGGLFTDMPVSPITEVFPARLSPGPQGYYELLRFPLRTYSLDDLAIIDDPFDISMGLVDLNTGRLINQLLHRGFIHQDLIFALLRVEPRTPKDSFYFRGPARFEKAPGGRAVFRFDGIVRVPYPPGFAFPQPNLTTGFIVGPNSVLDPFLWFQAAEDGAADAAPALQHEERNVTASTGDLFSYRYVIPPGGRGRAVFEYENHSQAGSFRMHSLAWLSLTNSRRAPGSASFDTVTFSGFGVWSKNGMETVQQAAVQVCTTQPRYVGIQIACGDVSNVNTKPPVEEEALP